MHGSAGAAVRVLHDVSGVQDAWETLSSISGSPMLGPGWTHAAAVALGQQQGLHVLVAGEPPRLRAIAPLFVRPGSGDRLEFVAGRELYEPMDFLYEDAASVEAIAAALAEAAIPVFLHRIPACSPVIPALIRSYRGRGWVVRRQVAGCSWLPLDPGWAQPVERLEPRLRSSLRRARRIARTLGPVRCEVCTPDPDTLPHLLDESFRVEEASWKGTRGTALMNDPGRGLFYRRFAAFACASGNLRVCFLRIGGKAAAMQLAVESGNRFWLLKVGYDPAFRRCSPGMLLTEETISHAAQGGLAGYEFLGIVEPWTRAWTDHAHEQVSIRAYPAGYRGAAALIGDAAEFLRQRVRGGVGRPEDAPHA
jgi:CelD/BcsL family acetyltransferase involved in cellulose biosynthesis